MASKSIQPIANTNPDPLGRSVDRVIAVVRQLLPTEHAALAVELGAALGDMFAELIGRATSMSASAILPVLENQDAIKQGLGEVQRRFDRRQQSNADIMTVLRDIQQEVRDLKEDHGRRLDALERGGDD